MCGCRKGGRTILDTVPGLETAVSAGGTERESCVLSPHMELCGPERVGEAEGWSSRCRSPSDFVLLLGKEYLK